MHRLVINPGAPTAWAFQLKPGTTTIGRSPANDCVIEHPSVSGSHCQNILSSGDALIRDLGSTNGTCVNRVPVQEAALQSGQPIQLGAVEALFETIAPVAVLVAPKANVTLAAETPSPAVPPPALTPPPAVPPLTAREVGAAFCKFHSQVPALVPSMIPARRRRSSSSARSARLRAVTSTMTVRKYCRPWLLITTLPNLNLLSKE